MRPLCIAATAENESAHSALPCTIHEAASAGSGEVASEQ